MFPAVMYQNLDGSIPVTSVAGHMAMVPITETQVQDCCCGGCGPCKWKPGTVLNYHYFNQLLVGIPPITEATRQEIGPVGIALVEGCFFQGVVNELKYASGSLVETDVRTVTIAYDGAGHWRVTTVDDVGTTIRDATYDGDCSGFDFETDTTEGGSRHIFKDIGIVVAP